MNLKTLLTAATLAAFATSTTIAYADHHMDAKPGAAKEKKSDTKKPVKKHSHAEEKSGMPIPESTGNKEKHDAMKVDRHDHTKDKH